MNDEERKRALEEISAQNQSIGLAVDLMNMYREFLAAPADSPQEDQLSKQFQDAVTLLANQHGNVVGNVITSFCDMLANTAPNDRMQEYLNFINQKLEEEVQQITEDE